MNLMGRTREKGKNCLIRLNPKAFYDKIIIKICNLVVRDLNKESKIMAEAYAFGASI